ncbi:MAG TPA: hypothetical protein VIQ48_02600, partial [Rhodanobacter sp.]
MVKLLRFIASCQAFPGILLSASATQPASPHSVFAAILLALIVAAMNIGLWWWGNLPHGPEDWHGKIGGFALSAFQ